MHSATLYHKVSEDFALEKVVLAERLVHTSAAACEAQGGQWKQKQYYNAACVWYCIIINVIHVVYILFMQQPIQIIVYRRVLEVPSEDCETEKRLRSMSPALSIASTVPYSDDGWPSFDIPDYDNTGLRFSVRVISICI